VKNQKKEEDRIMEKQEVILPNKEEPNDELLNNELESQDSKNEEKTIEEKRKFTCFN